MNYIQASDLSARFPASEMSGLNASGTAIDQAVAAANAMVDSYVFVNHPEGSIPSTPPSLVSVACDIARYLLWVTNPPAGVSARYEAAIQYLEKVADGKVSLGLQVTSPPGSTTDVPDTEASVSVSCRRFTRDSLRFLG
jgi:phage gp36-like protein